MAKEPVRKGARMTIRLKNGGTIRSRKSVALFDEKFKKWETAAANTTLPNPLNIPVVGPVAVIISNGFVFKLISYLKPISAEERPACTADTSILPLATVNSPI